MAIAPVVITFTAHGVTEVTRAFETVEARAAKAGTDRVRGAQREAASVADAHVKATEKWTKQREQIIENSAKMAGRMAERQAQSDLRTTLRAEDEKTRAVEREAKERVRALQTADRLAEQAGRDAVRRFERDEEQKTRAAARTAAARASQERQARESFARAIGGAAMSGASSGVGRVGHIAAGLVGQAMQAGGGFSIADSVQQNLSLGRNAALLANSAYIPGKMQPAGYAAAGGERIDPAKVIAHAKATAIGTGIDANDLVEGTRAYVAKSSDFAGGMQNMDFFAKIAKATGTNFQDVTKAAGNIKVQNKDLTDEGMKSMLLDVVQQGKSGSVEISDLARAAGKITKASSMYGMNQTDAQRQLLGLSQIAARTSGGSVDEAATELSMFGADTLKHQKKIGISNVTDKSGDLLAPQKIVEHVLRKTNGNIGQIQELGYGQRSLKFFEALTPLFKEAASKAGGSRKNQTEAGIKAVTEEMSSLTGAKYDQGKLDEDFKAIINTPAEQLEAAMRQLKDQVGDALVPELIKLVPVIKDMTPAFVSIISKGVPAFAELIQSVAKFLDAHKGMIDTIAANPIGAVIAFEVGKSVGGVMLGEAIKRMILGAMNAGGGVGGKVGGALGAGATIAAAAGAATVAGIAGIDYLGRKDAAGMNTTVGAGIEANNLTGILKANPNSPEALARAKSGKAAIEQQLAAQKESGSSALESIFGGGLISSSASDTRKKNQEQAMKESEEALKRLTAAINAAAGAVGGGGNLSNPANPARAGQAPK